MLAQLSFRKTNNAPFRKLISSSLRSLKEAIPPSVQKAISPQYREITSKAFLFLSRHKVLQSLAIELVSHFYSMKKEREPISVKVKTLKHFKSKELPKYETEQSSGFDVRAQLEKTVTIKPGERKIIPTGLQFEFPSGFELQARPRSGWAFRSGITLLNSPGTIDADYRGEVKVIVINHGKDAVKIQAQDRIAQLVLAPVCKVKIEQTTDLSQTVRGTGGFGSTGKRKQSPKPKEI